MRCCNGSPGLARATAAGTSDPAHERAAVVAEALAWEGTAFHHMGRLKIRRDADGVVLDRGGADCAYATLLIYRAALPHRVPAMEFGYYAPTWNLSRESAAGERYLATVTALPGVREVAAGEMPGPGDLALFRGGLAWAHGAIVIGWPMIAHANAEAGCFMRDRVDQGRLARRPRRFFTFWAE